MRTTVQQIRARKGGDKIVALTSYTAPFARILDPYVDILLVGDSLGMVLYSLESTLNVPLHVMIQHGEAVVRSSKQALVVVDMPFGSTQESKEAAFRNCARVMKKTGCQAVKLEGGAEMAETIRYLTERAIPVLAHIGLMPQHVNALGGFKVQGRTENERQRLLEDAKAVEQAGAFAVVIEGTQEDVAAEITQSISIPTIGIGASAACEGQVLVAEDMAGLSGAAYKFIGQFGDMAGELEKAARAYAEAVRGGEFPTSKHTFGK